ncbi:substrate-binding domain-containing protein [Nocardioides sp. CFH 31398]|uniref:substrate-binding domain-containing protein n=1 Tax=Nocardioides sp. CFH 31398 TaxID=2919579 RepID=UPI001F050E60|nr:substrate-binding domain-containing protein [Nocardioides sp. CFH 31398]MCH1866291.1 substrate-binding domain-containing protein [Nocardioides sp. CFH 31398]
MPGRSRVRTALVAGVLAPALTLGAAACSGGADEDSPRPVVAFLGGADPDSRHVQDDAELLRAALVADCEDCEYVELDAEGDADVQAEQMARVASGGADVVLLEAVDADAAEEMIAEVGDLPVITLDRSVPGADYHVGYDPVAGGRSLARAGMEAAVEAGAPAQGAGVLLLGAGSGDLAGTARTQAAREAIGNRGGEVLAADEPEVATTEDAREWTAGQVAERGAEAIDLVVAVDESQAEGVLAAFEDAGVAPADRPVVVGSGADVASLQRVVRGDLGVLLYRPRPPMTSRAVETAAEVLEGAPVTDTEDVDGVPSFLGTAEALTLRNLTSVAVGRDLVTTEELCDGVADACAANGIR